MKITIRKRIVRDFDAKLCSTSFYQARSKMKRFEGDDKYQDAAERRGPKGKPMAATLDEAETICKDYFSQGCKEALSIFEVVDTKAYEHGYNIVRGDESKSGRRLVGQCRVKFVKVVQVA